jgi:hypothetical protein
MGLLIVSIINKDQRAIVDSIPQDRIESDPRILPLNIPKPRLKEK